MPIQIELNPEEEKTLRERARLAGRDPAHTPPRSSEIISARREKLETISLRSRT